MPKSPKQKLNTVPPEKLVKNVEMFSQLPPHARPASPDGITLASHFIRSVLAGQNFPVPASNTVGALLTHYDKGPQHTEFTAEVADIHGDQAATPAYIAGLLQRDTSGQPLLFSKFTKAVSMTVQMPSSDTAEAQLFLEADAASTPKKKASSQ